MTKPKNKKSLKSKPAAKVKPPVDLPVIPVDDETKEIAEALRTGAGVVNDQETPDVPLEVAAPIEVPDLPGEPKKGRPKKLPIDEKKPIEAGLDIADPDLFRPLIDTFNLIIGGRFPVWKLSKDEIDALVKTVPPVLAKHFPGISDKIPEIALAECLAGIIIPRLYVTLNKPSGPVGPVGPAGPGGPVPVTPAPLAVPAKKPGGFDYAGALNEARKNAGRSKK